MTFPDLRSGPFSKVEGGLQPTKAPAAPLWQSFRTACCLLLALALPIAKWAKALPRPQGSGSTATTALALLLGCQVGFGFAGPGATSSPIGARNEAVDAVHQEPRPQAEQAQDCFSEGEQSATADVTEEVEGETLPADVDAREQRVRLHGRFVEEFVGPPRNDQGFRLVEWLRERHAPRGPPRA